MAKGKGGVKDAIFNKFRLFKFLRDNLKYLETILIPGFIFNCLSELSMYMTLLFL